MMGPASFPKTVQFRVSEKKCDWEIKEEPQPHPKRETVEEGSSRMWKGEQRQHDLDDIGRYRALVGQVDSTIAVEGLNNQDLAEYANSCRTLNINFIRTPPIFIRTCADECGNPIP